VKEVKEKAFAFMGQSLTVALRQSQTANTMVADAVAFESELEARPRERRRQR